MAWRSITALLVVCGLSASLFWQAGRSRSAPRRTDAPQGSSAAAQTSPRIFASGVVEGARRELGLNFEIPGRVRVVYVQEGDLVEEGEILAELDSSAADLRLLDARAHLKIVMAERDRIVGEPTENTLDTERTREGPPERTIRPAANVSPRATKVNSGDSPRKEKELPRPTRERAVVQKFKAPSDDAESNPQRTEEVIAETRVRLAESEVRMARLLLEQGQLRAPCAGQIVRSLPQPGELTGPDRAPHLFTLVDRSRTLVRAHVEEFDALRVSPGQKVKVLTPGKNSREYIGVVRTCAPWLAPKTQRHFGPGERLDVRVREIVVELDDAGDLLLGLPVEVWIDPTSPEK